MKTYISTSRNLVLFLRVNGRQELIRFRDMGRLLNYGIFSTDSPEVARVMEADARFGTQYRLQEGQKEEPETQKDHIYNAVYPDVKRTQEVKKILVGKYGVNGDNIKTREDAANAAERLNINFPHWL